MSKAYLLAFLMSLLLPSLVFADTVEFNITGKILPRTCSASLPNGGVINMRHTDISQFPTTNVGKDVYGWRRGSIRIHCPAAHLIYVTAKDVNATSVTPSRYLVNAASNNAAQGVGIAIAIMAAGDGRNAISLPTNKTVFIKGSKGQDYGTMVDTDWDLAAFYHQIDEHVTPGNVQSRVILTFDYR